MTSIRIKMVDGTVKDFPHSGRAGGSYTKSIRYEPGFVVVIDEWSNEVAIPTERILEVRVDRGRG